MTKIKCAESHGNRVKVFSGTNVDRDKDLFV
jgi:hypothetical protein